MNTTDCFKEGLLKKEAPSKEKSVKSLENAKKYIEKAMHNLKSEDYDLVIFCCYTSMFHAARAILFRDGIKERSHVCMIQYISEKYPKIAKICGMLDIYRRSRHNALYALDILYKKEDAEGAIDDANEFLGGIKGFLK